MADDNAIDKQRVTKKPVAGFNVHPENINREGRPKRKTLTELIHAKLDDTPQAWDAIVAMVIQKILTDKDKDVLKALWQYTDGMPVQKQVHSGDDESPIKVDISSTINKIYGQGNTTSSGGVPEDS